MNKSININMINHSSIKKMIEKRNLCRWLPSYHISPPFGLLNDPNALHYDSGIFSICYQWYPGGPTHGLKHWFCIESCDLITYNVKGVVNIPDTALDQNGAFTGSYIGVFGKNQVIYTGNSIEDERVTQRQIIADVIEGKVTNKRLLIDNERYSLSEFRDPSYFHFGGNDYIIVGAQTLSHKPVVAVFRFDESTATFESNIDLRLNQNFDMIECPQMITILGKNFLFASPQGLCKDGLKYQNTFNVVYCKFDKIDNAKGQLVNQEEIFEIDYGHDFYAPQIFKEGNDHVLIAWAGCGKSKYPEQDCGWMNILTMPRKLSVSGNKITQHPHKSIRNITGEYKRIKTKSYALKSSTFTIRLKLNNCVDLKIGSGTDYIHIYVENNQLTFDRTNCQTPVISQHGDVRTCKVSMGFVEMFFDTSIVEMYLNNNENTLTSRFYIENMESITSNVEYEIAQVGQINLEYEVENFEKL